LKIIRFLAMVALIAMVSLAVRAGVKALIGPPPSPGFPKIKTELPQDSPIKIADQAIGNRLERSYVFTDQDGKKFDIGQWYDKPIVISYIFTNCAEICPAITTSLSRIIRDNKDKLGKEFRVVSVGFDYKNDTVETMRSYGEGFTDNFDNWKFVTGPPETVKALADRLGIIFRPAGKSWQHTVGVTIVAPPGYVAAQVFGRPIPAPR